MIIASIIFTTTAYYVFINIDENTLLTLCLVPEFDYMYTKK